MGAAFSFGHTQHIELVDQITECDFDDLLQYVQRELPNGVSRFPFPRMHIEDTRTSDGHGRVFPAEVEQGTFSSRILDNSDNE